MAVWLNQILPPPSCKKCLPYQLLLFFFQITNCLDLKFHLFPPLEALLQKSLPDLKMLLKMMFLAKITALRCSSSSVKWILAHTKPGSILWHDKFDHFLTLSCFTAFQHGCLRCVCFERPGIYQLSGLLNYSKTPHSPWDVSWFGNLIPAAEPQTSELSSRLLYVFVGPWGGRERKRSRLTEECSKDIYGW